MKDKISNFADFACILPVVQQIIGIPITGYHLVRVISDLFHEVFKKEYVKTTNAYYDENIYHAKIDKFNCFMKQKKDSNHTLTEDYQETLDQERLFSFEKNLYDNRYRNRDYVRSSYNINYWRSCRINSIARLSELGFAFVRCLPVIGSCYSLYIYNTSNIYQPLIPEIRCGGDD
jgi:hypothetical protein